MFFVSRRRHNAELAAVRAERDASLSKLATAVFNRKQVLKQNAELDAANRRLEGRISELSKRIEERPSFEDSAALKARIRHLEKQLDDAVGLPPGRIEDSRRWQPGYQKPEVDAS